MTGRRWARSLLLAWLALLAAAAHAQAWETATPESQGMDSAALARLVDYGANVQMDSLVVVRHGRIVAEAYYAPFRAEMVHRINSATKAVVGALAGIAMARGELPGPQARLLDLLPDAAPADARWQAVTLQHLLDMTSGIDWVEPLADAPPTTLLALEQSPNWERFILQRGMAQAPGAAFNYNSGNPHLLQIALARRTGVTPEAYAAQHLFGPLGITGYRWRRDPQGVTQGGAGLYLHTRDMARLGQLYLQRGQWQGRQVVPQAWVDRVFAPRVDMSIPGYRYADFWWSIPRRQAYFAAGFNRQVILLLPELGIVAAVTGRMHYPFEDLISHLERAARAPAALPPDAPAQALLAERVAAVAAGTPQPAAAAAPVEHVPLARSSWRLEDNRLGLRELTLDFTGEQPRYQVQLRSRAYAGLLGMDGRFGAGEDAGTPVFTRARWLDAQTLEIEQRWPEEAGAIQLRLKFMGDEMEVTHTNMFGVRGTTRARALPPS